jgi:hypothetical protein
VLNITQQPIENTVLEHPASQVVCEALKTAEIQYVILIIRVLLIGAMTFILIGLTQKVSWQDDNKEKRYKW